MRTVAQIEALLPELEHHVADELEDQDLDFKQWDAQSRDKAVKPPCRWRCAWRMAAGYRCFGVADRVKGRSQAILGLPPEIDVNQLKRPFTTRPTPKLRPSSKS